MKNLFRYLIFVPFCLILLAGNLFAGEAHVQKFIVGDAVVWAIADSTSERDMAVFSKTPKELLDKYAPSGKLPSAIMTFIIQKNGRNILVDAGLGADSSLLMPGMVEAGVSPDKIDTVLITHMHGDHIGGLLWGDQKAFPNAQVLIGRVEQDFWLSDDSMRRYPDRKAAFEKCRRVVGVYGKAVKSFEFNTQVLPGIVALDSSGHTPGHTSFLMSSGYEKMLFWGDLAHAADLQFPRPDQNASFDMDPVKSAKAREYFMGLAAREKMPIAGAHLPFAAIGEVEKTGISSFKYIPF